jgi:RHS repeat-associated protein
VAAASYDAVGNQNALTGSASPYLAIAGTFSYDGENRLLAANLNAATVTYLYDGEGRRVQKTVASGATAGTTNYVYDAMGRLAAEYSTAANTQTGTQYLNADNLGSTRLVTDSSGTPQRCSDYLPFGEELPAGINGRTGCYGTETYPGPADATDRKFTGKERDAETGLDYFGARYFSGAQGRWTSPDPSNLGVDFWLPQTWNRYAMSLNNPLKFVDRNGLWPTSIHERNVDESLPGLSGQMRQLLKDASYAVDHTTKFLGIYDSQSAQASPMHSMSDGTDPDQAEAIGVAIDLSDRFIEENGGELGDGRTRGGELGDGGERAGGGERGDGGENSGDGELGDRRTENSGTDGTLPC